MDTIQNKKGARGYLVTGWNASGAISPSFLDRESAVKVITRAVEVVSCGKKQMTLRDVETGDDMTGRFWSPAFPIYADIESAQKAGNDLANQIIESSIKSLSALVEKGIQAEISQKALDRIKNEGLNIKVMTYSDAIREIREKAV
jgi:hypothetical protein